jgi:hypothetical protein
MYRPRTGVLYCAQPGRTQEEQLLQRQLSLEDVAFRQAEVALDVERRQDLPVQDAIPDVRRVLGDRVHDRVAERLPVGVPASLFLQVIRRVLHEARHDVLPRWGDRRIGQARDDDVDIRLARIASVLRFVVRALHVFDARRDRHGATQMMAGSRQAREVRQPVERHVHLAGRSAVFVSLHVLHELANGIVPRANICADQARGDDIRDSSRRSQDDAGRGAVFHGPWMRSRPISTPLRAPRWRSRWRSRPSTREEPTSGTPSISPVVVRQHVGRARQADAQKRPNPRRRHRRLEHVGLEPRSGNRPRSSSSWIWFTCLTGQRLEAAREKSIIPGIDDVGSRCHVEDQQTNRPISIIALPYSS